MHPVKDTSRSSHNLREMLPKVSGSYKSVGGAKSVGRRTTKSTSFRLYCDPHRASLSQGICSGGDSGAIQATKFRDDVETIQPFDFHQHELY